MSSFDVFLSYSSLDAEIAEILCKTLESKGVSCWIAPRNITPGMHWGEAIIEGINASKIMVVVFSDNSNKSQQVLREVERAVSKGLYVLPFRIQPTLPSKAMEYFLSTTHWFNALTTPVEVHAERLVDLVGSIIPQSGGGSSVPEAPVGEGEAAPSEQPLAQTLKPEPTPNDKLREQVALVLSHAQETCAMGMQAVDQIGVNSEILKTHFKDIETALAGKEMPVTLVLSKKELTAQTFAHLGIDYSGEIESKLAEGGAAVQIQVAVSGKKLEGITLQLVPDANRLLDDLALANRLVTESALVITSGERGEPFSPEILSILTEMARQSSSAVVVHGKSAPEDAKQAFWWNNILSASQGLSLPVEFTGDSHTSSLKSLFTEGNLLRLLVHLFEASHRLWDATVLAADEREQIAQSLRINQATKRREIAFIDSLGLRSVNPAIVERLGRIDAELIALVGGLEKLNQRALSPGGKLHSLTRKLVQRLDAQDLRQEAKASGGVVLKDERLKALSDEMKKLVADHLRSASKIFDDGTALVLDEELGGDGSAMRVRELARGVARPYLNEVFPDATVLKSHYRGEIKTDGNEKAGRFKIFKKFMKAALDLTPFIEPARGALSWELQLFGKEILDRLLLSYQTSAEGVKRAVRAGLGAIPDESIQARRTELEEKLTGVDASLLAIEARARDIQDLQQACAEVDSGCRSVVREVIKPVINAEEVAEAVNG